MIKQYYQECIALGSKTGLSLVSGSSPQKVQEIYSKLWKAVFSFERRFSRFIPDSELSAFNNKAGMTQPISVEFAELLGAAKSIAVQSEGLFNPFVLPALQRAGYLRSRVPGAQDDKVDDHSARSIAGIERLELGSGWARIPFDTALDLGGIGKGYLADRLANMLPAEITGYWFSLGGDIALGGLDADDQVWKVEVENASPAERKTVIKAGEDQYAIATSGTNVHKGRSGEGTWHHIINPRTAKPADTDIVMATICDKSALRSDVLASCAVILGHKDAIPFLRDKGVKRALIQYRTQNNQIKMIDHDFTQTARRVYA